MQPKDSKEPNEPKSVAKEPEEPKPSAKPKQDHDIHRVFWERTRLNRAFEALAVQGVLWGNLLVSARGTYTGLGAIIPFTISIVIVTYLLISVTGFGDMIDIALMILYSFSTLGDYSFILFLDFSAPKL